MKRLLTIAGLLVASVVGIVTLRSYNERYAFATATRTFTNLRGVIEAGVIRQGWLPDFLPRSAYNIREKHNGEQHTVIACFSFDPVENILPMLSEAKEVPLNIPKGIWPSVIGQREAWFPEAIFEGKLGALTPPGFRLYRVERKERVGPHEAMAIWHLALNQEAGVCYLWFFQHGVRQ
jgi:hypothetical protein